MTENPPRKRRWTRWLLEIGIFLAIFLLIQAWMTRDAPRGPAPDITGNLLDGTPVTLSAMRGEPVLVHFWATWCPICGMEQGSIDAIADDHRVLTIAMDDASNAAITGYLEEKGVDYPVIHDPDYRISREYAIRGVPTSFIVDANGNIRFVETGYTTGAGLRLRLWWAGLKPQPASGSVSTAPSTTRTGPASS